MKWPLVPGINLVEDYNDARVQGLITGALLTSILYYLTSR